MSLLGDLAVLVDPLVSQTINVDFFLAHVPSGAPDTVTALYEYGGRESRRTFGGDRDELPRVQVLCRSTDYEEARARAQTIHDAFEAVQNQIINGTRYKALLPLQVPFPLGGADANGRHSIVFNAEVDK